MNNTTYTVQLRYSQSDFLGRGPVRPDGTTSITFGKFDYLSSVIRFNSYGEALSTAQTKYHGLSEQYVIITPYVEPVIDKRYEVWITLPCVNGLRTYILSGHESFVPLLMIGPDLPALQWLTSEQATAYANKLQLIDYKVVEVWDEF